MRHEMFNVRSKYISQLISSKLANSEKAPVSYSEAYGYNPAGETCIRCPTKLPYPTITERVCLSYVPETSSTTFIGFSVISLIASSRHQLKKQSTNRAANPTWNLNRLLRIIADAETKITFCQSFIL